jgi:hypothetical protein
VPAFLTFFLSIPEQSLNTRNRQLRALHFDQFVSAAQPMRDAYRCSGDMQYFRQISHQRRIRLTLYRLGLQAYFQSIVPRAHNFAFPGVRRHVYAQSNALFIGAAPIVLYCLHGLRLKSSKKSAQ